MSSIWTKVFWQAAVERALSTTAQTALALVTIDLANGTASVLGGWQNVTSISLLAGALSVLKSVAANELKLGGDPGPSLGAEVLKE